MTDLTTEIIGFREWHADTDGNLFSMFTPYTWRKGVNKAHCAAEIAQFAHPHDAPRHNCECGLYAYHDMGWLTNAMPVVGAIQAWGDVEVHYSGFRAQYARIVALGVQESNVHHEVMRTFQAASRYNVPCVLINELEVVASEFGQPVPKHLRPEVTFPILNLGAGLVIIELKSVEDDGEDDE